jgi:hypothetical protein
MTKIMTMTKRGREDSREAGVDVLVTGLAETGGEIGVGAFPAADGVGIVAGEEGGAGVADAVFADGGAEPVGDGGGEPGGAAVGSAGWRFAG